MFKLLRPAASAARRLLRYRKTNEFMMTKDLREAKPLRSESKVRLEAIEPKHREIIDAFHEAASVDAAQRDRVRRYLDHGHGGLLGLFEGELIGYVWWSDASLDDTRRHPHLQIYDIPLGARDVYIIDLYVDPKKRRSGRAIDFSSRIQLELRERGYERAYGLVSAHKVAAKWLYATLGWRTIREHRGHVLFNTIAFSNGRVFSARRAMF